MTIKVLTDQEIVILNNSMGSAAYRTKLGDVLDALTSGVEVSLVKVLSEALAVAGFTDGGATSGYKDLVAKLPSGAVPIGWKFVGTGAFDGNTSAVMQVGISGDLDRFSADTAGSVFTAVTVGSSVLAADACKGISAEVTVRVTVTSATDFTAVKTAAHGAGTLYLYYVDTE